MRTLLIVAAIMGALFLAGKTIMDGDGSLPMPGFMKDKYDQGEVETRVVAVLEGLKQHGSSASVAAQTAICQWSQGINFIKDQGMLETAVDRWDKWRKKRGLYARPLTTYEILSIEREPPQDGDGHIVTMRLSGQRKPVRWRVVDGQEIEWLR